MTTTDSEKIAYIFTIVKKYGVCTSPENYRLHTTCVSSEDGGSTRFIVEFTPTGRKLTVSQTCPFAPVYHVGGPDYLDVLYRAHSCMAEKPELYFSIDRANAAALRDNLSEMMAKDQSANEHEPTLLVCPDKDSKCDVDPDTFSFTMTIRHDTTWVDARDVVFLAFNAAARNSAARRLDSKNPCTTKFPNCQ